MRKTKQKKQTSNTLLVVAILLAILIAVSPYFILSKGIFVSGFESKTVQEITMEVSATGYSPNTFTLKQGVPVRWNIEVTELTGCNEELLLQDYGIDVNLKEGKNQIEFTPEKTGIIRWSCGMNMLRGSFLVTETGDATPQQIAEATPAKSGGCGCKH